MTMSACFLLTWAQESADTGVAFAPKEGLLAHELVASVQNLNELPFLLNLYEGRLQDYQANSLTWPLMSEKMKRIVESNLKGPEGISWLSASVATIAGKQVAYNIPRFKSKLDVLSLQETKYIAGTDQILKPVFSRDKIKNYSFFHLPSMFWQITSLIYVDEETKKKLEKAALSGLAFERAAVI